MKFGKLVGFLAVVLGLLLFWRIRFVVLLGFLAVTLATILNRLVRKFIRMRLKRGWAIAVTLMTIFIASTTILAIAVPPFVEQIQQWLDQAPRDISTVRQWLDQLDQRVPFELSQFERQLNVFMQNIPSVVKSLFDNFVTAFRSTLSVLLNSFLVLAITVMLLANPNAYRHTFVSLFPDFYRPRVEEVLDGCEEALAGWGIGILFNMAVITLMSFIGLVIIGAPLPIANACIAGILTFIPNVGPVLSVIPPAVLAALDSPWKGLAVVILYIIIQQVESNFLTPLVMNHQVSLLPAATLIFQVVFGLLFGIFGLFLALPIVVVGQVWLQEVLVKDVMDKWQQPQKRDRPPADRP